MATTTASRATNGRARVDKVVRSKRGIILDVGCGANKQPGSVGMDHQDIRDKDGNSLVDVVHDWNVFPWPFEDESVLLIVASHVVEHVNPADGHFLDWMNEVWRILKPGRQIAIACPYGNNEFFVQDPTHCNPCNQTTWIYFDPEHHSNFYHFYEPAPFEIVQNLYHTGGMMEVVLRKRLDKAEYHSDGQVKYGPDAIRR